MEVFKKVDKNSTIISVVGTLDVSTTPILESECDNITTKLITIDLLECNYITSAALRLLLVIRKKYGEENFKLINVGEEIEHILHITGFDVLIKYELAQGVKKETDKLNFVSLLEKNVRDYGKKDAYVFLGKHYTWKDIDIGSQIIAHKLAKLGVKKGSHVAIDSPNTINWIMTFYAIQKLGAIAILVNFSLKPKEIAVLVETADITHFCYGAAPKKMKYKDMMTQLKDVAPQVEYGLNISPLVNFFLHKLSYPKIKKLYRKKYNPDDASVVIFTSGSTGKPKAVLNSAYNSINSVFDAAGLYECSGSDRNLALLPCFHVFGLAMNLTIPALRHYTSYIPTNVKADYLIDLIDKYKITIYATVPTLILALVKAKNFDSKKVASLRLSLLGGAATTEPQILMLKEKFENMHVCNVYGMSENPLISATRYEDTIEHQTKTVGKPFGSIQVEIRSLDGKVLRAGEEGEICIKCDSMIICYYKLPVDKQVFDERGFMPTGDLGFIDEDGYIHLVGRAKDLIIRGGENISPGEIAEEISKLDYISDVKVLGVPHELLGEEVAAAIVLKNGTLFNRQAIVSYLSTKLAKFKIPAHFVIYDKFPLLGSGKVDSISLKKDVIKRIKEEHL